MKNFLSIKEDILRLRDCGKVYCEINCVSNADDQKSLEKFGEQLGFSISDNLKNIDKNLAIEIINLVFTKDLAYSAPLMSEEESIELSSRFIGIFEKDAKFFTNASFGKNSANKIKLSSWNPITNATFDTGIFVIDKKTVGCLWVEDED